MNEEDSEKRRVGRPKAANPKIARLPVVQITPESLETYREAAEASGTTLSKWVRDTLDKAAKRTGTKK